MAVMTLNPDSNLDNQPAASPSAEAFMRAFREFHRLDNPPQDLTDTPEYQLAMYALEGAQARALVGRVDNHDEGALAALVAYGNLQLIIDGGYTVGGGVLEDDDLRSELVAIQNALQALWRYHDREGARAVRSYAKYVGAAERADTAAWQDGR